MVTSTGPAAAATGNCARTPSKVAAAEAVVLVEGVSDQIAVDKLAARMGRDLVAERRWACRPAAHALALSEAVWRREFWLRRLTFYSQPQAALAALGGVERELPGECVGVGAVLAEHPRSIVVLPA